MNSRLSFFDHIRFFLYPFVNFFIYLFFAHILAELFGPNPAPLQSWVTIWQAFIIDGAAAFLAVFFGLVVLRNPLRMIGGVIFANGLFILVLFLDVFPHYYQIDDLINSWIRLSFTVIGAMLALYFWSKDAKESLSSVDRQAEQQDTVLIQTPRLVSFLAILLAPLTYFGLWIYALVPICFSIWISTILIADPVVPMYAWVFLTLVNLVCLVYTIRIVGMTIFQSQALQPALRIHLSEYKTPQLSAVVREVCQTIGCRLSARVILHAEPRIFVVHGKLNIFDGIIRGTVLAIGSPLLRVLTMDEFKALIAHEFLFFRGKAALYTKYVLPLYRTFDKAIGYYDNMMEKSQTETDIVPMMRVLNFPQDLFLHIYHIIYTVMDRYIGGERQLRADRQAAECFGSNHFASGLRKSYDLAMSFERICYKLPFSEDNFFERVEKMHAALQEGKGQEGYDVAGELKGLGEHIPITGSQVSAFIPLNVRLDRLKDIKPFATVQQRTDMIRGEVRSIEVRLSLIYQYFRDIKRYYNELKKALKQYQTNPLFTDVLQNIAIFIRKFLKK
jgi:hypothetical protein